MRLRRPGPGAKGAKVSKLRAELVMPGRFDAAEMPRLDAFDEEFGQDPGAARGAGASVLFQRVLTIVWLAQDGERQ
jgi:hypothetical protein